MLLGDAVADVPCAERVEREHQLRDVVEARHGASYGVDGLGKELSQPWRVIDIALISIFVGCPVAVLVADCRREKAGGLWRHLKDVPAQALGNAACAQSLQLLPTALHDGLRPVGRLSLGLGALPGHAGGQREARNRPGRCRLPGKSSAELLKESVLPQPPLQLQCVATRDAQVSHVVVLYARQGLQIIEATLQQNLGVPAQADAPQEGHHRVGLVELRPLLPLELLQLPPKQRHVDRFQVQPAHVRVLHVHQLVHAAEAAAEQPLRVLREAPGQEEGEHVGLPARGRLGLPVRRRLPTVRTLPRIAHDQAQSRREAQASDGALHARNLAERHKHWRRRRSRHSAERIALRVPPLNLWRAHNQRLLARSLRCGGAGRPARRPWWPHEVA
mmetsp:Transcript_64177/g.198733  ORF Transcript_64177/g.198733 Transcript_64177/m.198733 type:complete len:389 (-) Transcript_64177:15-1181(-)